MLKLKSTRKLFMFIIVITSFTLVFVYHPNSTLRDSKNVILDLSNNYLRPPNYSNFYNGFLVNNSKCQIPNINIWNDQFRPFWNTARLIPCSEKKRNGTVKGLTFVRKRAIVINGTKLLSLGLDLNSIFCCYRTIERVQQNIGSYNKYADKDIKFSDNCHAMTSWETIPISGFTKVTCEKKGWFWNSALHTEFHLLASFQQQFQTVPGSGRSLHEKIKFWREKPSHHPRPSNVLLIGIDTTSRSNFHRMMNTSMDILRKQFNAIEMNGYTKVGINTFPNFVPLISSFSVDELKVVCNYSSRIAQDDCPYIWKQFSTRNYLTAHIEDCPLFNILSAEKIGFVRQPVDIYPRPWMLATYPNEKDQSMCVEDSRPDEIVLRYVADLIELSDFHGMPYFITVWLTQLTHNHMGHLKHFDVTLTKTLGVLRERVFLENSVLLIVGDHGYRFHGDRRTYPGWFEDKLPTFWVSSPVSLRTSFTMWKKALIQNANQLVTPFDVYETLKHISVVDSGSNLSADYVGGRGLRGRSLFTRVPVRSCGETGVPYQFCACASPEKLQGDVQTIVRSATDAVLMKVNGINENISSKCLKLEVDHIRAFAALRVPSPEDINITSTDSSSDTKRLIIIGIKTNPGNLELEAMLRYNGTIRKFEVFDVYQSEFIDGSQACVPEELDGSFCRCDNISEQIYSIFFKSWLPQIYNLG